MADFCFQKSYYVTQSPYSKIHCYDLASSTHLNKDYPPGAEGKGQTPVLSKFKFFTTHRYREFNQLAKGCTANIYVNSGQTPSSTHAFIFHCLPCVSDK